MEKAQEAVLEYIMEDEKMVRSDTEQINLN